MCIYNCCLLLNKLHFPLSQDNVNVSLWNGRLFRGSLVNRFMLITSFKYSFTLSSLLLVCEIVYLGLPWILCQEAKELFFRKVAGNLTSSTSRTLPLIRLDNAVSNPTITKATDFYSFSYQEWKYSAACNKGYHSSLILIFSYRLPG